MSAVSDNYKIGLISSEVLDAQWPTLESVLVSSFQGAQFSDGYDASSPIQHTRDGIEGRLGVTVAHALAHDTTDSFAGGVMCIPIENPYGQRDCDIGWMFTTPNIPRNEKLFILDGLVAVVRKTLYEAGYSRLVTSMGTVAGQRVLVRRYGFITEPATIATANSGNKWILNLDRNT
jgi:hypothetical protein